jgi:meiosis-specific transcription factor NDT80
MEPTLSAEEAKSIEESPSYLYYPGAIYEDSEQGYQLPRICGRWEGVSESKGYFPALVAEGGMNITGHQGLNLDLNANPSEDTRTLGHITSLL